MDVGKGRCQYLAEQTLWRQQLSSEGQLGSTVWWGSQHVFASVAHTCAPHALHEVVAECEVNDLSLRVRPRGLAQLRGTAAVQGNVSSRFLVQWRSVKEAIQQS